jgi:RNA polymerase sigma factor (sigma-70 family)
MNHDELGQEWREIVKKPDPEAWRRLCEKLSVILVSALARTRQAEDLTHFALTQLWERRAAVQIRDGNHLKGWLLRTAMNKYREEFRNWDKKRRSLDSIPQPMSKEGTVLDKIVRDEELALFHAAIEGLSDLYREVAFMRYSSHLSNEEIASSLGLTPVAVRKQLSRATAMLLKALDNGKSHKL